MSSSGAAYRPQGDFVRGALFVVTIERGAGWIVAKGEREERRGRERVGCKGLMGI